MRIPVPTTMFEPFASARDTHTPEIANFIAIKSNNGFPHFAHMCFTRENRTASAPLAQYPWRVASLLYPRTLYHLKAFAREWWEIHSNRWACLLRNMASIARLAIRVTANQCFSNASGVLSMKSRQTPGRCG